MLHLLRHPLFIALVSITYLAVAFSWLDKSTSEREIRGAFDEMQRIADELATSDEPGRVKEVLARFSEDIVDGFKAGFGQGSGKDLREFLAVRDKVTISGATKGKSSWPSREKIVAIVKNGTKHHISDIKVNLTSYSEDKRLIDSVSTRLSDIRVLAPGEEQSFSIDRDFGSNGDDATELAKNASHTFDLKVLAFDIEHPDEE